MEKIMKCTSRNCPEKKICYRHNIEDKKSNGCQNYEYTCNEDSGFDSYIKDNEIHKKKFNINGAFIVVGIINILTYFVSFKSLYLNDMYIFGIYLIISVLLSLDIYAHYVNKYK